MITNYYKITPKVDGDIIGKKKNDIRLIDFCRKEDNVNTLFISKMTKQLVESGTELLQEDIKNCVCVSSEIFLEILKYQIESANEELH